MERMPASHLTGTHSSVPSDPDEDEAMLKTSDEAHTCTQEMESMLCFDFNFFEVPQKAAPHNDVSVKVQLISGVKYEAGAFFWLCFCDSSTTN